MAPLVPDSAMQGRNGERSERCGPVWDGQSGVVAGDQGPGNQKNECCAGYEYGVAVERAIVGCEDSFQRVLLIWKAGPRI